MSKAHQSFDRSPHGAFVKSPHGVRGVRRSEPLLYVVGKFTEADGEEAKYVAAWDGAAWQHLWWNPYTADETQQVALPTFIQSGGPHDGEEFQRDIRSMYFGVSGNIYIQADVNGHAYTTVNAFKVSDPSVGSVGVLRRYENGGWWTIPPSTPSFPRIDDSVVYKGEAIRSGSAAGANQALIPRDTIRRWNGSTWVRFSPFTTYPIDAPAGDKDKFDIERLFVFKGRLYIAARSMFVDEEGYARLHVARYEDLENEWTVIGDFSCHQVSYFDKDAPIVINDTPPLMRIPRLWNNFSSNYTSHWSHLLNWKGRLVLVGAFGTGEDYSGLAICADPDAEEPEWDNMGGGFTSLSPIGYEMFGPFTSAPDPTTYDTDEVTYAAVPVVKADPEDDDQYYAVPDSYKHPYLWATVFRDRLIVGGGLGDIGGQLGIAQCQIVAGEEEDDPDTYEWSALGDGVDDFTQGGLVASLPRRFLEGVVETVSTSSFDILAKPFDTDAHTITVDYDGATRWRFDGGVYSADKLLPDMRIAAWPPYQVATDIRITSDIRGELMLIDGDLYTVGGETIDVGDATFYLNDGDTFEEIGESDIEERMRLQVFLDGDEGDEDRNPTLVIVRPSRPTFTGYIVEVIMPTEEDPEGTLSRLRIQTGTLETPGAVQLLILGELTRVTLDRLEVPLEDLGEELEEDMPVKVFADPGGFISLVQVRSE